MPAGVGSGGRCTGCPRLIQWAGLVTLGLLAWLAGMAGRIYLLGAFALSVGLLYFGVRMVNLNLPITHAMSKARARQLLQATVIYLPLLFALMMTDSTRL